MNLPRQDIRQQHCEFLEQLLGVVASHSHGIQAVVQKLHDVHVVHQFHLGTQWSSEMESLAISLMAYQEIGRFSFIKKNCQQKF